MMAGGALFFALLACLLGAALGNYEKHDFATSQPWSHQFVSDSAQGAITWRPADTNYLTHLSAGSLRPVFTPFHSANVGFSQSAPSTNYASTSTHAAPRALQPVHVMPRQSGASAQIADPLSGGALTPTYTPYPSQSTFFQSLPLVDYESTSTDTAVPSVLPHAASSDNSQCNSIELASYIDSKFTSSPQCHGFGRKLVVGHRGAPAYLPEHTLAAKALAIAMGVDYIEQDVAMTRDNQLVVSHGHRVDENSDVHERFPERRREDGRFWACDFDMDELRTLRFTSTFRLEDNNATDRHRFEGRFPLFHSHFGFHTLEEEFEMIKALEVSLGRRIGVYTEIKSAVKHRYKCGAEPKDIARATLEVMKRFNYTSREDRAYFQSFDPAELKRVKDELLPELGLELPLVQLIAQTRWMLTLEFLGLDDDGEPILRNFDYDPLFKGGLTAMQDIALYADGIGPHTSHIYDGATLDSLTDVVDNAHNAGLTVHAYTFRAEALPAYAQSYEQFLDIFLCRAGIDGVFADQPDRAVAFLRENIDPNDCRRCRSYRRFGPENDEKNDSGN